MAAELVLLLQNAHFGSAAFPGTTINVTPSAEDDRFNFNVVGLTGPSAMELLTFDELRKGYLTIPWTGIGVDALDFNDLQDGCGVVGLNSGTKHCIGAGTITGQHVSFQPYRTLYLHSSSESDSVGPRGETSIILSVVVGNTVRGDLITLNESATASPIAMPTAVSELRFQLRDVNGKNVDLEGHDMSFALIVQ
jgi:hypothetical protein